mgnify:CR=1 FL=1
MIWKLRNIEELKGISRADANEILRHNRLKAFRHGCGWLGLALFTATLFAIIFGDELLPTNYSTWIKNLIVLCFAAVCWALSHLLTNMAIAPHVRREAQFWTERGILQKEKTGEHAPPAGRVEAPRP